MKQYKNLKEFQNKVQSGEKLMLYRNKVLDVSTFKHPGPQELITDNLGKDIQQVFDNQGHSDYAVDLLTKYQVGTISYDMDDCDLEFSKEEEEIHRRLDKLIDPTKPLCPQVRQLSREEFIALVSKPRYYANQDSIRHYENNYEDFMNTTYIYFNSMVILPVSMYFVSNSIKEIYSVWDFLQFSFTFFIGIYFFWTLVEYYFHRIRLHGELSLPEIPTEDQLENMFKRHLNHHVYMNQKYRIAQRIFPDNLIYGLILLVLCNLLFNKWTADIMFSSITFGSHAYDLLHYYFHHGGEPYFQWLKRLKANHMRHHYRNSKKGFGVSATLWDQVFGT